MKILDGFDQGSIEWANARCGRITMSHAKELLTGGKGKTREGYLLDVVAERLSGQPIDGYYGLDMQRGNFLEDYAAQAVSTHLGTEIQKVSFVLHDSEQIGCSPDGLVEGGAGVELKCPKPRQHLKNITGNGFKDYLQQVQGGMWICERDSWVLASFCPWVSDCPLYIEIIGRDEEMIGRLEESALDGIRFIDERVSLLKESPPNPRVTEIAVAARSEWEAATNELSDVIV